MSEMWVQMVMGKEHTVISTFAGCGGSSLGYKWAGFKELLAIDYEKNAVETFKLNFDSPIWQRDIKTVTGNEILKFCEIKKGELDILDGSPPCQGFSTAGKQKVTDSRNNLFLEYVRLINELEPKVFIMENVTGMMKGKFKGKFNEILGTLRGTGYNIKCKLMNAKYYEVPQSRERLIFIGVRGDIRVGPVYPVAQGKLITVKNVDKNDRKRAKYSNIRYGDVMLKRNRPCQTITKISRYFYNEQNLYGIESLKAFQSFPDNFNMTGSFQNKKERIGNSVPPKMMYHIAKTVREEILDKMDSKNNNPPRARA